MIRRTRRPCYKPNIVAIVFLIELAGNYSWSAGAWYIAPPRANSEWQQLAQLVVETFDAPDPRQQISAIEWWTWNLFQKRQCLRQTYQQYTRTARRMRHMKHTILLAKDQGRVIGMVELGISSTSPAAAAAETYCDDDDYTTDLITTAAAVADAERRRPTIGVLCVDADYRQRGVAKDLVDRCIDIVANDISWRGGGPVMNDNSNFHAIYAEVEPDNAPALAFFTSQGFVLQSSDCRNVTVRRRNRIETRPHFLLGKPLPVAVSSVAQL